MKTAKTKNSGKRRLQLKIRREVITTHINADFDALSSMLAASKLYPEAALVFPGSHEKNLRNFFIHSTSYLFNFTKLKQISLDHIERLILVDTRQKSRVGPFAEVAEKKGVEVHIYDHHPDSADDIHGDLEVIRKTGSATALLTQILREKDVPVSPDEATIMCLGIHEDTGSFTFSSTTHEDYEAGGWLTSKGADHNIISDMLTRELTTQQLWLLNDLTKSATAHVINGVEIIITKVISDDYVGDFAVLVHKLMEMENLNVVFAIAQMENRIYLVARSRLEEVNAAEVALAFGGGGHPQAASATIKNQTLIQVEESLVTLLNSRVYFARTARDMMSSPVIQTSSQETIKHASESMTRYNINVLLVVDDGHLKGYITRQIVEKVIYFQLGDLKVQDYMNIEFSMVDPNLPLRDVQEFIIGSKQRILPVVENDDVLGVITRTDLLNILVGTPSIPDFLYDSKTDYHFIRNKNMSRMIEEQLPEKICKLLVDIGQVADSLGFNCYIVGGLVRDIFLRRANLDVDIVIEGDGIQFAAEFAKHYPARVRTHKKFGTAVLIFPDGFKVDVATARIEYYEAPGAPPIVETSSLKLDLYRRDFTINTLAVKLNNGHFGNLIDYFGAQKDVKDKMIRVLHNLSFVEDPTRMLRAVRFEQRFGFTIGKLTLALLRNAARMDWIRSPASKRILQELKLILMEKDPLNAVKRMGELDLLQFISPEIKLLKADMDLLEEIEKVIAWYVRLYLDQPLKQWKIYWYGLTGALKEKTLDRLNRELEMPGYNQSRPSQRKQENNLLDQLFRFEGSNYELYTMLLPYDMEKLLYLMAKSRNEKTKRLISSYFTKLKGKRISLMGRDLIQMGLKPGPIFREIFERLLEARLNDTAKTRDDEMQFVLETFGDRLTPH